MAVEVEIGREFGRWVVVEKLDYKQKYTCRCSCGEEQNIRVYDLLKGKTSMCRVCSAENAKSPGIPVSSTTEYNTWIHINQRCHNPSNKDYKNYGGRGIQVYPLWRESYEAFVMYMGNKPAPHYTIERLDVNKGYEPGNVSWIPRNAQARNKRTNVRVTINGNTATVAEWVEGDLCSAPAKTVYKRIERGWEPRDAILTPVGATQGYIDEIEKYRQEMLGGGGIGQIDDHQEKE